MLRRLWTALLVLCLLAGPLAATWSIVVVDLATGEVAVVTATCLTNFDLRDAVPVIVPGFGAAAHQSSVDSTGQNRLLNWTLLQQGVPVDEILQAIKDQDSLKRWRQIGIVSLRGDAVTFSGKGCGEWAGGVTGQVGSLVYAIQGNVLTGQPVVDAAEAALRASTGPLPERLLAAMDAAASFGGDGRCSCSVANPTSCGAPPPNFTKSAHIATLLIGRPGDPLEPCDAGGCARGDLYLALNVAYAQVGDPDPVLQLHQLYAQWKLAQPGRPDAYRSDRWISQPVVPAGGAPPVQIVIDLNDLDGAPVGHGGHGVTLAHDPSSAGGATLLQVHDHQDGSYTLDVQPGAAPGVDLLRVAVDDGIRPITLWPPLELVVAPPAALPVNDPAAPPGLPLGPHDAHAQLLPGGLTAYLLADGAGGGQRLFRTLRPDPFSPFGAPVAVPGSALPGWSLSDYSVAAGELELFVAAFAPGDPASRIYRSRRPDTLSPWEPLELLPELDGDEGAAGPCLSPDGLVLVYARGIGGSIDLWSARRPVAGGRFAPPRRLAELDGGGDELDPLSDANGTRLIFARRDAAGRRSLWSSDRIETGFGPPVLLPGGLESEPGAYAVTAVDEANDSLWLTRGLPGGARAIVVAPRAGGSLSASAPHISAAAGGRIDFALDAGPAWAGADYLLLAATAGGPPSVLAGGGVLPFAPDSVTSFLFAVLGQPNVPGFAGQLDAHGQAAAALILAPNEITDPGLIGRSYLFAFVAELAPRRYVSQPVSVELN